MADPDLRTVKRDLKFHTTLKTQRGKLVDMYALYDDAVADATVSIGVPHGRRDIADFVIRSLKAGQNVLMQLPPGYRFIPDEATPDIGRKTS